MVKKGIRIDMERVQKIYTKLDETLRNMPQKPNGAEMFAVCYFLLRTIERAGEHKTTVKEKVK